MGYSLTFVGDDNQSRNTYTDWNLIPESPPVVPTPSPKTNYVDIPGRTKGPIDLSTIIFNKLTYERVTGSWNFIMRDDYWYTPNRPVLFNTIRSWLHGRTANVTLEEDQSHYFRGRFTVDPPSGGQGPFVVRINFDLEPVRYHSNGVVDSSYVQTT